MSASPCPVELLRSVCASVPFGLIVTDREAQIVYINEAFTRITGYEASELLGQNPRILSAGQTKSVDYAKMWAAISSGNRFSTVLLDRKKDGQLYWAQMNVFPLFDADGNITHYAASHVDVSNQRRARKRSQAYRDDVVRPGRLQVGMVLREDVRAASGALLIAAGHVVDELLRERLTQLYRANVLTADLAVRVPVRRRRIAPVPPSPRWAGDAHTAGDESSEANASAPPVSKATAPVTRRE